MKKQKTKAEIINLSDHDKLINLISIHNEKEVNQLLQSVDQVFIEVFDFKKKDLPWLSNNSEAEWDKIARINDSPDEHVNLFWTALLRMLDRNGADYCS